MNKVEPTEPCPRCKRTAHVRHKFILIDSGSGKPPALQSDLRTGCACEGDLSVDGLKAEFQSLGPLAQFTQGLYCDHCGVGYIPEIMAKPAAPTFQPTPGGWRRVYPDGTLGPLLERMSDDPEVQKDLNRVGMVNNGTSGG